MLAVEAGDEAWRRRSVAVEAAQKQQEARRLRRARGSGDNEEGKEGDENEDSDDIGGTNRVGSTRTAFTSVGIVQHPLGS